jgi:hypothetical protein
MAIDKFTQFDKMEFCIIVFLGRTKKQTWIRHPGSTAIILDGLLLTQPLVVLKCFGNTASIEVVENLELSHGRGAALADVACNVAGAHEVQADRSWAFTASPRWRHMTGAATGHPGGGYLQVTS